MYLSGARYDEVLILIVVAKGDMSGMNLRVPNSYPGFASEAQRVV